MSNNLKPKPRFWPVLFITAFVLGAILWALWMSRVIRQTREIRDNPDRGFFVPMASNAPNGAASGAVKQTNANRTNAHKQ